MLKNPVALSEGRELLDNRMRRYLAPFANYHILLYNRVWPNGDAREQLGSRANQGSWMNKHYGIVKGKY